MTKAETVFEKLAKKNEDFSLKQLGFGVAGGTAGAIITSPLSTISNVAKNDNHTFTSAIKSLNADARAMKSSGKFSKALNYIIRYNRGLLPKILTIGPATGVAWAVSDHLKHKFGD